MYVKLLQYCCLIGLITCNIGSFAFSQGKLRVPISKSHPRTSLNWDQTPFDLAANTLPPNYQGHKLLDIYYKLALPTPKGEFETAEEYQSRVALWKTKNILGRISPTDYLAFKITDVLSPNVLLVEYNADKEEMSFTVDLKYEYFDRAFIRWLELSYESKKRGTYIGITPMNVKFRVATYAARSIGVAIKGNVKDVKIKTAYQREQALRDKQYLKALAIGTLSEPYKWTNTTVVKASLDHPEEWRTEYLGLCLELKAIWIVHQITGEVVAKMTLPGR